MMWCACGLVYFDVNDVVRPVEKRLPLVKLSTYSSIRSTTSRTVLSQTFVNDSKDAIKESRYDFPLYDGVSVVDFTCQIGSRTIQGVVKEKSKAKEVYDQAKSKGETAGLLARGPTSDVFSTILANIPAGEHIVVKVTYIGELKYDVGAQCTKFTIPTSIAPRYGSTAQNPGFGASQDPSTTENGMEITVDMDMGTDSAIREVRSPSHPIAMKVGTTSVASSVQAPQMSQASATLSQGSVALEKDFILEIVNDTTKKPQAMLETYLGDLRQRALMITLIPEISLAQAKPEIFIVADRSGSMGGEKIRTLVRALKIFLRSLPVGACFNICSFGSTHNFLWPRSREYGEESLAEAISHVDSFGADYGGTETLAAVRATIEARDKQRDLAIILCTDGDIWQQDALFSYLNTQLRESSKPIRVFPLGIGDSVSSSLIEGVARAGRGFASTVGEHEKLDGKIVRMLKGALTENVLDYKFDIKYGPNEDDMDDDFVLVEEVADCLGVISLDDSQTLVANSDTQSDGPEGLPAVGVPKYLQSPQEVPPLYPSTRYTIYVMISADAPQKQPVSIILKGTSSRGPIHIDIPVEKVKDPSKTIHQLAARKSVGELEEGRGWLNHAKDEEGVLLQNKYGDRPSGPGLFPGPKTSKFEDMVQREAVRLGVEYQVGGKFCSFVAVEADGKTEQQGSTYRPTKPHSWSQRKTGLFSATASPSSSRGGYASSGLFGASVARASNTFATPRSQSGSSFGQPQFRASAAAMSMSAAAPPTPSGGPYSTAFGFSGRGLATAGGSQAFRPNTAAFRNEDASPLERIISFQRFQGYWDLKQELLEACGLAKSAAAGTMLQNASGHPSRGGVWATILAIAFLERQMVGEQDTWELIVDKAKGWLESNGVHMEKEMEIEPLKSVLSEL